MTIFLFWTIKQMVIISLMVTITFYISRLSKLPQLMVNFSYFTANNVFQLYYHHLLYSFRVVWLLFLEPMNLEIEIVDGINKVYIYRLAIITAQLMIGFCSCRCIEFTSHFSSLR